MTKKFRGALGAIATAAILIPATAQAQITRVSGTDTRQSFGVNFGAFIPKGDDCGEANPLLTRGCLQGRAERDVLFTDRRSLLFDTDEFNGVSFGAEWLVAITNNFEAGADVGFYQHTVPSIYRGFVNVDDSEIEQRLKLRIIPVTASVRFLPLGRDAGVQPYVGIGVSLLNWRYTESGEFIDFSDDSVFRESYVAKGNAWSPTVLGGVRFPVADVWTLGGEVRYQNAHADTGGAGAGFLDDRIDLGGLTWTFNMSFRF